MKSTLTYFIIFLFINAMNSIGFKSLKHASLIDMVNQTKFIAVKHNVTTEDGYIIEIHQISKLDNKKNKRVIFVQHGLLCSSDIWLDNGPNSALAYVMAENGYNVFLGNVRGNTYGRHHINISTGDSEFWNFTFHEMAKYDLPAMLDYVMKLNNIDKIDYIGHSQGTIILFILLSIKPEWNDKIIKHYALAPVATLRSLNVMSTLILNAFRSPFYSIFVTIFKHEFLKNIYIVDSVLTLFCKFISHRLCSFSINAVCGDDDKCFKKSDISYILKHSPAGTSFKNMKHYLQVYENNGIFQPFDNGCAKNKIIYNSCKIPPYNYSNIKVKTVVYVGTHDDIANPENIEILEGILPNIIKTRVYQNWNHIHFNWGADCNLTLHKNIISDIEN